VTNTHYDTDGVLSAFALLEPEFALARRAAFLDAARTGDFQVFTTEAALRIDLALTALGDAVPDGLPALERRQAQYERAFAALPGLFEDPFAPLPDQAEREATQVQADVARVRSGAATVRRIEAAGLAVVTADPPLHRVALNTAAGDLFRVLAVTPCGSGHLYRYHDRVEGWFEVVSFRPPRRLPLEPLAARLDALEASETEPRWLCHDVAMPVPECWFGEPGGGRSLGPGTPGALCVSRLTPRLVERAVLEHFLP
jgi:hypothetical protein